MRKLSTQTFITDNFLLHSKEAETLFHDYAKHMPIIDYHNHLSVKQIAENKPIDNIKDAWLSGDHYKWRGMRANGIDEKFITGKASKKEKFEKWAKTVPFTLKNPLFHWTQLELKRYFTIDTILQPSSSEFIYETVNKVLASKTTAVVMFLICTSMAMSWLFSFEGIPEIISAFLQEQLNNKFAIFLAINLILLIVGTFMDMTPAVLIFTPIFLPVVTTLGMDPVHFGIVIVLNLCIGICTPPVGTLLFVGSGVANIPATKVVKPLLPFLAIMIIGLMLISFIPEISMFLPKLFNL